MDQAEIDVTHDLSTEELSELVRAVVKLTTMADRALEPFGDPLVRRVRAHIGEGFEVVANRAESFPSLDRANVQVALDELREVSTSWEVIGLNAEIGHYGGVSLAGLVSGTWQGPGATAAQYTSVSTGLGETIACLRAGVMLATIDGDRVAFMVCNTERHQPEVVVEIVAPTNAIAEQLLDRIRRLMDERNVMRGKVMSFSFGRHGEFGITFVETPIVRGSLAAAATH